MLSQLKQIGNLLAISICSTVIHLAGSMNPAGAAELFLLPGTTTLYLLGEIESVDIAKFKKFLENDSVETVGLAGPGGSLETGFSIGKEILNRGLSTTTISGHTCASSCALIFLHGKNRSMEDGTRLGLHTPFLVYSGIKAKHFADDIRDKTSAYCAAIGVNNSYLRRIFPQGYTEEAKKSNTLSRTVPEWEMKRAACLMQTYQKAFEDALRFINFFETAGVDDQVLINMLNTPPDKMRWYDTAESKKVGLATNRLTEE